MKPIADLYGTIQQGLYGGMHKLGEIKMPAYKCFKCEKKITTTNLGKRFVCPHCGYAPDSPPVGGIYYCAKCGKSSRLNS